MKDVNSGTLEPDVRKRGSFLKQAAILAVASLLVRFIGFLYRVPLTNMIGDEGNSIYASGYYFYTLFLILSSAGLPAAISKLVAERLALKEYANAHNVFRVSLLAAGGFGLVCSFALAALASPISELINNSGSYYSLLSLAPTIFIVAVMSVFRGYFQGMNTTVPTAISQIVEQIFNAVFSVLLAYFLVKHSVELGSAGGTAGTGIGALAGLIFIIFSYYLIRPMIHKKLKTSKSVPTERRKEILIKIIKTTVPVIIGTAMFSLTNLADMFMVLSRLTEGGIFTSEQANVLYGQLSGKYVVLTTLPISIATALATAVVPNITTSFVARDTFIVKKKVDLALRCTMIITIPAAMGLGVLADQILLFLFPDAPEGGYMLRNGSVAILFLSLTLISTGILQGTGKVHIPAIFAAIGASIKIILNYFLIPIPEINVMGAIISTIACYAVTGILNYVYLLRYTNIRSDFVGIFIKPMAASLVMGIGCYAFYYTTYYLTNSNAISTIMAILIGMFIYFLFMLFIRGFRKADLLLLPKGKKIISLLEGINLI